MAEKKNNNSAIANADTTGAMRDALKGKSDAKRSESDFNNLNKKNKGSNNLDKLTRETTYDNTLFTNEIKNMSKGKDIVKTGTGIDPNTNYANGGVTIGGMSAPTTLQWKERKVDNNALSNLRFKHLTSSIQKGNLGIIKEVSKGNDALNKIHNFQQTIQANYYKTSTDTRFKILSELTQIKNALYIGFNIDPRTGKQEEEKESKDETTILQKLMFKNGFGGFKEALGSIKDDAIKRMGEKAQDATGMGEYISMLKMFDKNEIGQVLTSLVKQSLVGLIKDQAKKKAGNKYGGIYDFAIDPENALRRSTVLGNNSNIGKIAGAFGIPIETLSSLLGVNVDKPTITKGASERDIRIKNINRDHAAFDGKAHHALTQIIPDLLAKQLAVITGNKSEQLYVDWTTGDYINKEKAIDLASGRIYTERYANFRKSLMGTNSRYGTNENHTGGLLTELIKNIKNSEKDLTESGKLNADSYNRVMDVYKAVKEKEVFSALNKTIIHILLGVRSADFKTDDTKDRTKINSAINSLMSNIYKPNDDISGVKLVSHLMSQFVPAELLANIGRENKRLVTWFIYDVFRLTYVVEMEKSAGSALTDAYGDIEYQYTNDMYTEQEEFAKQMASRGATSTYNGANDMDEYMSRNILFGGSGGRNQKGKPGEFKFSGGSNNNLFDKNSVTEEDRLISDPKFKEHLKKQETKNKAALIIALKLAGTTHITDFNMNALSAEKEKLKDDKLTKPFDSSKYSKRVLTFDSNGRITVTDIAKTKGDLKNTDRITNKTYKMFEEDGQTVDKIYEYISGYGFSIFANDNGYIHTSDVNTADKIKKQVKNLNKLTSEDIDKISEKKDEVESMYSTGEISSLKSILGEKTKGKPTKETARMQVLDALKKHYGSTAVEDAMQAMSDYETETGQKPNKFQEWVKWGKKKGYHFMGGDEKELEEAHKALSAENIDKMIHAYQNDSEYRSKIDQSAGDIGDENNRINVVTQVTEALKNGNPLTTKMIKDIIDSSPGNKKLTEANVRRALALASNAMGYFAGDSLPVAASKSLVFGLLNGNTKKILSQIQDAWDTDKMEGKTDAQVEYERAKANDDFVKMMAGNNLASAAGGAVGKWMKNNMKFGGAFGFVSNVLVSTALRPIMPKILTWAHKFLGGGITKRLFGSDVTGSDKLDELKKAADDSVNDTNAKRYSKEDINEIKSSEGKFDPTSVLDLSGAATNKQFKARRQQYSGTRNKDTGELIAGKYKSIDKKVLDSQCAAEALVVLIHSFRKKVSRRASMSPTDPLTLSEIQKQYTTAAGTSVKFFTKAISRMNGKAGVTTRTDTGYVAVDNIMAHLRKSPDNGAIALIKTDIKLGAKYQNHFVAIKLENDDVYMYDPYITPWYNVKDAWKKTNIEDLAAITVAVTYIAWGKSTVNIPNVTENNDGSGKTIDTSKPNTNETPTSGKDSSDNDNMNIDKRQRGRYKKFRDEMLGVAGISASEGASISDRMLIQVAPTQAREYASALTRSGSPKDAKFGRKILKFLDKTSIDDEKGKSDSKEDGDKKGGILETIKDLVLGDKKKGIWNTVKSFIPSLLGGGKWLAGVGLAGMFGHMLNKGIVDPVRGLGYGLIGKGLKNTVGRLFWNQNTEEGQAKAETAAENVKERGVGKGIVRRGLAYGATFAESIGKGWSTAGKIAEYGGKIRPTKIGEYVAKTLPESATSAMLKGATEAGEAVVKGGLKGTAEGAVKFIPKVLQKIEMLLQKVAAKLGGAIGAMLKKILTKGWKILKKVIGENLTEWLTKKAAQSATTGILKKTKTFLQGLFASGGVTAILNIGFMVWGFWRGWRNTYKAFGQPSNAQCTWSMCFSSAIAGFIIEAIPSLPFVGPILGTIVSTVASFFEQSLARSTHHILVALGIDSEYAYGSKGVERPAGLQEPGYATDDSASASPVDTVRPSRVNTPSVSYDTATYSSNAQMYNADISPYAKVNNTPGSRYLGGYGYSSLGGKGLDKLGKITKMNSMPTFISQTEFSHIKLAGVNAVLNGCALACAKMINLHYEKNITDEQIIRTASKFITDEKSVSIDFFSALRGTRVPNDRWVNTIFGKDGKMITVLVSLTSDSNHFVNIYCKGSTYYMADPMQKEWKELSIAELEALDVKFCSEFTPAKGLSAQVQKSLLGGSGLFSALKSGLKAIGGAVKSAFTGGSSKSTSTTSAVSNKLQSASKAFNETATKNIDYDVEEPDSDSPEDIQKHNENLAKLELSRSSQHTSGMNNIKQLQDSVKYGMGFNDPIQNPDMIRQLNSQAKEVENSANGVKSSGIDGHQAVVNIARQEMAKNIQVIPTSSGSFKLNTASEQRVALYLAVAGNPKASGINVPTSTANMSWCASFATFCLKSAGADLSSCTGLRSGAFPTQNAHTFEKMSEPKPGYLIVWLASEAGGANHVAIISEVTEKGLKYIGGNQGGQVINGVKMRAITEVTSTNTQTPASGKRPCAGFYRCKTLPVASEGDVDTSQYTFGTPQGTVNGPDSSTHVTYYPDNIIRTIKETIEAFEGGQAGYDAHKKDMLTLYGFNFNRAGETGENDATLRNLFYKYYGQQKERGSWKKVDQSLRDQYLYRAMELVKSKYLSPNGIDDTILKNHPKFAFVGWQNAYAGTNTSSTIRNYAKQLKNKPKGDPLGEQAARDIWVKQLGWLRNNKNYREIKASGKRHGWDARYNNLGKMLGYPGISGTASGLSEAEIMKNATELLKEINASSLLKKITCGPYALGSLIINSGAMEVKDVIGLLEFIVKKYDIDDKGFTIDLMLKLGFERVSATVSGNKLTGTNKDKVYMLFGTSKGITHYVGHHNVDSKDYYYDNRNPKIVSTTIDKTFSVSDVFEANIMEVIKVLTGDSTYHLSGKANGEQLRVAATSNIRKNPDVVKDTHFSKHATPTVISKTVSSRQKVRRETNTTNNNDLYANALNLIIELLKENNRLNTNQSDILRLISQASNTIASNTGDISTSTTNIVTNGIKEPSKDDFVEKLFPTLFKAKELWDSLPIGNN